MNINQFPQDVQEFIHELCAKAVLRAIKNGNWNLKEQNEKIQSDNVAP
ncbi:hypothetical protein [Paenibacillus cucumis (ex Kampfer et al. 2016)]|uniref:Uncharacterized protein n=1 Tax=Paenibacillus cucumis (ex Kampfer et al. 2016) TaxID=1776858 RepID=A0ABS7KD34_9BACL|nr:hypothetical protein [Paenibacillus cucumis (ex Kampfer et al. 2016)]MBY0202011.1 hypothetical protein [Paenibacillus cucumis (ex Kampfer et al. 2016)]